MNSDIQDVAKGSHLPECRAAIFYLALAVMGRRQTVNMVHQDQLDQHCNVAGIRGPSDIPGEDEDGMTTLALRTLICLRTDTR